MDESKFAEESYVEMTQPVMPNDTNAMGGLFGGTLMKWIDLAGAMVATRHGRTDCATVALDQMDFMHAIMLSEIVTLKAKLTWTGTTSMEIKVDVFAEHPHTAKVRHTNTAYIVMVALDENRNPTPVPKLKIISNEQKMEYNRAEERRRQRLARTHNQKDRRK